LFLFYLGYKTLISRPVSETTQATEASVLFGAYGSSFLLTLSNPQTILSLAGIFMGGTHTV
jgi:threonine/homoserine/homoserine lactone efflux protein